MNISEFLEARIAEDERHAGSGWARLGYSRWETDNYGRDFLAPSAVLAECKAKRAIIDMHETYSSAAHESVGIAWVGARGGQQVTSDILRTLAAVYADHPDYQREWAA